MNEFMMSAEVEIHDNETSLAMLSWILRVTPFLDTSYLFSSLTFLS